MTVRRATRIILPAAVAAALLLPGLAAASPYPDSGRLYREFKDESFRTQERRRRDVEIEAPLPESDFTDTGEQVPVLSFAVHGNTRLSGDEIDAVLTGYVGQELTSTQIHSAADELSLAYRAEGYFTARVYVPPQPVVDGVVHLYVFEGWIEDDGLHYTNSGERVSDAMVRSILERNLPVHQVLERRDVERTILLINDLPGITSHSTLFPGEQAGSAGFLLETVDEPRFSGNIDSDNFGSYYTGEARVGSTVYWNSPTRRGDQLTLRVVTSGSDSNYGFVSYSTPFTGSDARFGFSVDYLDYELGKQFSSLGSEGDATEFRAFASFPFIRSRHLNSIGQFDYSHLDLNDEDDVGLQAERTVDSAIISVSGDHDDDWLASGTTYFNVSATLGDVNLDGNQAFKDFDRTNAETEGGFAKMNFALSRLQGLVGNWSTYLSVSGQIAGDNLDSSQKFFIGGPFSVPGYPVGEVSGDDGVLVHADVRYDFYELPWGGTFQVSGYYAYGWAKLFNDTWDGWEGGNPVISNNVDLRSIGLGLNQSWGEGFVIRGMLGWQLGINEGRDPLTGEDSDGSDDDFRGWIQGIFYF